MHFQLALSAGTAAVATWNAASPSRTHQAKLRFQLARLQLLPGMLPPPAGPIKAKDALPAGTFSWHGCSCYLECCLPQQDPSGQTALPAGTAAVATWNAATPSRTSRLLAAIGPFSSQTHICENISVPAGSHQAELRGFPDSLPG